jgi:anti-sigma regulatory factor (Ser/Thr protein kinase)
MVSDETDRVNAVRRYRILDTEPEQAFDDLTLLASQICATPIALISLVDGDRQWFKSRVGMEATETSRNVSFCAHALEQQDLFIVPDALDDARFRDNPLVRNDPRVRFYAGAPLMTREGEAIGTLCVIDRVPRTLSAGQKAALAALRRQAEAQLELRRNLEELRVALEGMEQLGDLVPYCSTCELNVVIPANMANMVTVSKGVSELLARRRWPDDEAAKVELALSEALSNAIRHGCKNDPSKKLQCCVTFDEAGELVIVVRDPGPGFDPAAVPDPLEEANLTKPGGRGVFLINHLMDTVEYTEEGRQVMMRKRPEAGGGPPLRHGK